MIKQYGSGPLSNISSLNNENTVEDKIYERLFKIGNKSNKKVKIENPEKQIITFNYGADSAKIIKRLHNTSVGEDGGEIRYYAEHWDCKHYDWWKSALEDLPIYYLDTTLDKLAMDAQIPRNGFQFSPESVINFYHLDPTHNADRYTAGVQWVINKVTETLNPLLKPDFEVGYYEGHLRLIPLTKEAEESRYTDNAVYNKAKLALQEGATKLDGLYKNMEEKLKRRTI